MFSRSPRPACSAGTRAFQSRTSQTHNLSHVSGSIAGPPRPQSPWGSPAGTPSPRAARAKGNSYYSGPVAQRGWVMGHVFLFMYFTNICVLLDISMCTWEHRTKSRGTVGECQQERENTHTTGHRRPQGWGLPTPQSMLGGMGPSATALPRMRAVSRVDGCGQAARQRTQRHLGYFQSRTTRHLEGPVQTPFRDSPRGAGGLQVTGSSGSI